MFDQNNKVRCIFRLFSNDKVRGPIVFSQNEKVRCINCSVEIYISIAICTPEDFASSWNELCASAWSWCSYLLGAIVVAVRRSTISPSLRLSLTFLDCMPLRWRPINSRFGHISLLICPSVFDFVCLHFSVGFHYTKLDSVALIVAVVCHLFVAELHLKI